MREPPRTVRAEAQGYYAQGLARLHGEAAAPDPAAAARLFARAARLGHAKAQYRLAVLHLKGEGVGRDPKRAAALLRAAAESGHNRAQYRLGMLHATGDGIARDTRLALRWLKCSADAGNEHALRAYARLVATRPCDKPMTVWVREPPLAHLIGLHSTPTWLLSVVVLAGAAIVSGAWWSAREWPAETLRAGLAQNAVPAQHAGAMIAVPPQPAAPSPATEQAIRHAASQPSPRTSSAAAAVQPLSAAADPDPPPAAQAPQPQPHTVEAVARTETRGAAGSRPEAAAGTSGAPAIVLAAAGNSATNTLAGSDGERRRALAARIRQDPNCDSFRSGLLVDPAAVWDRILSLAAQDNCLD